MKFYGSEHGQFYDRGEAVMLPVNGLGKLPAGKYKAEVVSYVKNSDDEYTLILTEPVRGGHIENLPLIPWIEIFSTVEVEIGMRNGSYLRRRSNGALAL